MILKASTRGRGAALADHLLNQQDNDHVEVHDVRGLLASDLRGAFQEIEAVAGGTRCQQYLFSLSLSPPHGEDVPIQIFENVIERIEKKLQLEGQARAIIFHEKEGRRHAHCVWSRIDTKSMKALDQRYFKLKLRDIGRQVYLEQGWKLPNGFLDSKRRDPENFTIAEWQHAKRLGENPKDLKAVMQECWAASDNLSSFQQVLEERGFFLAEGDRRGFVAVDYLGHPYSLSRALNLRSKEIAERLGEANKLPSLRKTQERIAQGMTATLERHIEITRNKLASDLEPFLQQREELRVKHRFERTELDEFLSMRRANEISSRASKLPRGLKGIWYKITGKYRAIQMENERLAKLALERDRAARQMLIQDQLQQRRNLKVSYDLIKQEHCQVLDDLRQRSLNYLKILGGEAGDQRSLSRSKDTENLKLKSERNRER